MHEGIETATEPAAPAPNSSFKRILSSCAIPVKNWATRAYAAGPELRDALTLTRRFARRGDAATLGYWPGDADTPRSITQIYLSAIDALTREPKLSRSLSIKAPAVAFDQMLVRTVVGAAKDAGISVYFDSRACDAADRTFELIDAARRRHERVGCAIPGRWRRSIADADWAVKHDVDVRVVKGEWADIGPTEVDRRAGFLAVIDRLAGCARHVAVATHDFPLAREALTRLRAAGTSCELQLLLGLPTRALRNLASRLDVPIRMYVPYGHSRVPYHFSWMLKQPRVLTWIARDVVFGRSACLFK